VSDAAERARATVAAVYRTDSRRVLATLVRLLGDFDLAIGQAGVRGSGGAARPPGGFPVEQNALAFDAPGISRERTVIADHPVAGNGDGEIVRRARTGDSAYRLRGSDAPRDLRIGDRLAHGNALQRLPYTLLESSAADVEREVQTDLRPCPRN
jgi:hypothetical protein